METTEPARGNTAGDGVRHPSYGLLGGKDGLPHRYVMVAGGKRRVLKTKEAGVPIPPGAVFDIVSAGGGGWGKPVRRDPEARAADLENGFVTRRGSAGAISRPPQTNDSRVKNLYAKSRTAGAMSRPPQTNDRRARNRNAKSRMGR
jgi:N-methylhydantoinase B